MIAAYILLCSDGTYYVGSTRDLEGRIAQHESGRGAVYTSTRRPVELVWRQEFDRVDEAWACERRLHGWSHAKKDALVRGQWELLPALSRKKFPKRRSGAR